MSILFNTVSWSYAPQGLKKKVHVMLLGFYCCQVMHVNSILLIKPIVFLKMYKENTLLLKILFREGLKGRLTTFFNNTFVVFILRLKPTCIITKMLRSFKKRGKKFVFKCNLRICISVRELLQKNVQTVIPHQVLAGVSVFRWQSYKPKTEKCQNNAWQTISHQEWGRRKRSHPCSDTNHIQSCSCDGKEKREA